MGPKARRAIWPEGGVSEGRVSKMELVALTTEEGPGQGHRNLPESREVKGRFSKAPSWTAAPGRAEASVCTSPVGSCHPRSLEPGRPVSEEAVPWVQREQSFPSAVPAQRT